MHIHGVEIEIYLVDDAGFLAPSPRHSLRISRTI